MLAVSGQLNPRMFGPSMFPSIPREAIEGHSDPATVWCASGEREQARRTIYAHVKRSLLVPILETLDFCDTARTAAQRSVTTVAPQALTLFNGEFVNRQAQHLADRLLKEAGPDASAQVERLLPPGPVPAAVGTRTRRPAGLPASTGTRGHESCRGTGADVPRGAEPQ